MGIKLWSADHAAFVDYGVYMQCTQGPNSGVLDQPCAGVYSKKGNDTLQDTDGTTPMKPTCTRTPCTVLYIVPVHVLYLRYRVSRGIPEV